MGGKHSRNKGAAGERELVSLLPGSVKVSRSGYSTHDVEWLGYPVEVKRRADGFKTMYRWLRDASVVCFRADRSEWLVTMRVETLLDLLESENIPQDKS